LERLYCTEELRALILNREIVQINHTLTAKRGTVRGLHFQRPPHAETKFVSCLRGEVFDVAVDLRQGSPTFLHWYGRVLSSSGHETLVIPEGFAHGYQSLGDDCEMLYFHTVSYQPSAEAGLNAKDPALAIEWPEPITELSPRDSAHPMTTKDFRGVAL
jgi:dTDP-4-dehydrorhamnose 3,5-epimerase